MDRENRWIWQAGAFAHKCGIPQLLCRRQRFEWRNVACLVERIMLDRRKLLIVVRAAGKDPRNPSEHDQRNAAITALVVSRQPEFRPYRRRMRVYLEYPGPVMLETTVDLASATKLVAAEISATRRNSDCPDRLASPILSYLLGRR